MFKPVSSKVNFPELEQSILKFWKENRVFEKSLKLRENSNKQFTLYDGPPTANGKPGIHHVLSRVYKDIIPRYKTMKGFYAPRKAGWDTHGLPVELEIEKKLGFTRKNQIEEFGIEKFNKLCRESVFMYVNDWNNLTERIGFWIDIDKPYVTLDNDYIESVWWALKSLNDKGLIYRGYKVTPHCPRCGTSLSSHEVALGYKEDTIDPSIYIKFYTDEKHKLTKIFSVRDINKPVYFLAWTTTPWTLPGNTALAVSPHEEYVLVEFDNEYLILADKLKSSLGLNDLKIAGKCLGRELTEVSYEPLYNPHKYGIERLRFVEHVNKDSQIASAELNIQSIEENLRYRVIWADFVSMEDGTGIVHIAPAFGEDDFNAGKQYGLDFVQHVDLDGKIKGNYKFAGKFVKDADTDIAEDLKERGLLFKLDKISHTYPFCWRCDTPVLYYAKKSWYIRTTAKRDALISGNELINWYPEHIKYGRFGDWLKNNVDWAFSRERFWGTPLNAWYCSECDKYEFIGSLEELRSKSNLKGYVENLDLHRPYIDSVTFECQLCKGEMHRVSEVIDCWFDSGAMPFAQWHYPFENTENYLASFPADYISEAIDQTRGWFYSLHAISILLNDMPCYKNVICLGHILDMRGEKMSKTKGNVIDPMEVIDKYGADATRWYLFSSSPPGNVKRFSIESVSEIQRNFLMTLWNVYSFFVMYANIDQIDPRQIQLKYEADIDLWILTSLNSLTKQVDYHLENYDPTTAARKIEKFVDELSNWYIRRSRRRFWKSQNDTDKLSAYGTLYRCLVTLSKLMAPFAPFISEEIYRNLVCSVDNEAPISVHLCDFPVADDTYRYEDVVAATELAINVCSLGRAARAKAGVKIRQPLSRVIVETKSSSNKEYINRLCEHILEELNVKKLEVVDAIIEAENLSIVRENDIAVAIDTTLSEELESEGLAREIVRRIQVLRKSANFDIDDKINIYFICDDSLKRTINEFSQFICRETLAKNIIFAENINENLIYSKYKVSKYELTIGVEKSNN